MDKPFKNGPNQIKNSKIIGRKAKIKDSNICLFKWSFVVG